MSMDDDYRALLNKLAAKRAVERFTLMFIAACVVGVGVLLFLQNRELATEVKNQQHAANQSESHFARTEHDLEKQNNEIQQQTNQLAKYIKCIAEFFARPDHSTLTLQNLQSCHISSPNSSANSSVVMPTQPKTTNPNAQQPTTSEPPRSSPTPRYKPPQPQTTAHPTPQTAPPSFFQRAASLLRGLVKTLAVI